MMPAAIRKGGGTMLYKLVAILVLLWLVGLATFIMLGGLIHLLLIVALFVFLVEFMTETAS
jgi:hypothetical protein